MCSIDGPSKRKGIGHSHCLVGVAAEVSRDHRQPRGLETGQYSEQILLEPQLVLTRLEDFKTGSESRQRHVQDCVSHGCVFNEVRFCLVRKQFMGSSPLGYMATMRIVFQCWLMSRLVFKDEPLTSLVTLTKVWKKTLSCSSPEDETIPVITSFTRVWFSRAPLDGSSTSSAFCCGERESRTST